MSYKVAIKKNATGEVRMIAIEWDWFRPDRPDGDRYWWIEGNFGCDCNRHDQFEYAGGNEDPQDQPCGDIAYSTLYVELPDGTRIDLTAREL